MQTRRRSQPYSTPAPTPTHAMKTADPLHEAAECNANPAILTALLDAGADPKSKTTGGQTAWDLINGKLKDTDAYWRLYALPPRAENMHIPSSFWKSATPEDIQDAIASVSDPHARDDYGQTPLHQTANNKDPALVIALLGAGADPNARDNHGKTPLHEAAFNENPTILTALLDAGADPNARAENDNTPLYWAAGFEFNKNPAVVQALLDAGANPNARAEHGRTPLHGAARDNENPAVVQTLLDAGADLNARDEHGLDPPA